VAPARMKIKIVWTSTFCLLLRMALGLALV